MITNGVENKECTWYINVSIEGHLDGWINECFNNLTVLDLKAGNSYLYTEFPDISAVYGFILLLRDTGVNFNSLSIERK